MHLVVKNHVEHNAHICPILDKAVPGGAGDGSFVEYTRRDSEFIRESSGLCLKCSKMYFEYFYKLGITVLDSVKLWFSVNICFVLIECFWLTSLASVSYPK